MRRLYILSLIFLLTCELSAQSQTPCSSEVFGGFDFWIGEWMVTDTLGNKQGENLIQRVEQGCLVTETWTSATGSTGRSMNYFDPEDSTWNQLWVSSNGFILSLKGLASENSMSLTSKAIKGQQGNMIYHRITWTLNPDETVTQLWEVLNEQKEITSEAFRGIYTKK